MNQLLEDAYKAAQKVGTKNAKIMNYLFVGLLPLLTLVIVYFEDSRNPRSTRGNEIQQ